MIINTTNCPMCGGINYENEDWKPPSNECQCKHCKVLFTIKVVEAPAESSKKQDYPLYQYGQILYYRGQNLMVTLGIFLRSGDEVVVVTVQPGKTYDVEFRRDSFSLKTKLKARNVPEADLCTKVDLIKGIVKDFVCPKCFGLVNHLTCDLCNGEKMVTEMKAMKFQKEYQAKRRVKCSTCGKLHMVNDTEPTDLCFCDQQCNEAFKEGHRVNRIPKFRVGQVLEYNSVWPVQFEEGQTYVEKGDIVHVDSVNGELFTYDILYTEVTAGKPDRIYKLKGIPESHLLNVIAQPPKVLPKSIVQVFRTSDGAIFDKQEDAVLHQRDVDNLQARLAALVNALSDASIFTIRQEEINRLIKHRRAIIKALTIGDTL